MLASEFPMVKIAGFDVIEDKEPLPVLPIVHEVNANPFDGLAVRIVVAPVVPNVGFAVAVPPALLKTETLNIAGGSVAPVIS